MARFHVAHMLRPESPGFEAYKEVIDTVLWGLRQIGHEATYGVNEISKNATNIIFGANLLPEELLHSAPEDTICYNLEQLRWHPQFKAGHELTWWDYLVQKFQIWDYSGANIPAWNSRIPRLPVKHLSICYAPVLTSIPKAEEQDIDVLIYGGIGGNRLPVFSALAAAKMSVVFAHRLYGAGRDNLISRSKIVLNISLSRGKIFEVVRASYLMANSKAVISDFSLDSFIEEDIPQGVIFVPTEGVVPTCRHLLTNEDLRVQAEHRAFECISRRDIRQFLSAALA